MLGKGGKKPSSMFMRHGLVGARLGHEEAAAEKMALGVGESGTLCDSPIARNQASSPTCAISQGYRRVPKSALVKGLRACKQRKLELLLI